MIRRPIEEELVDFLLADSEIQAGVRGRMGPQPLEQGSRLPALTYFQAGRPGGSQVQEGAQCLVGERYQIDCWGDTYGDARTLADLVRKRLDGYQGDFVDIHVQGVFLRSKLDAFEDESKAYRVILDFDIWYQEEA